MSAPTDPSSPGSSGGPSRPSDRTPIRSTVRSGAPTAPATGVRPAASGGAATPPPGPPRDRLASLGRVALVVVLVAAVVVTVVVAAKSSQFGRTDAGADEIPALEVQPAPVQLGAVGQPSALAPPLPGLLLPPARPNAPGVAPQPRPQAGRVSLAQWANDLGPRVGVPPRALQSYGIADLALRQEAPGCHLSWVTVAGLARIESNHGRYKGSTVSASGDVTPPIVGVPLDGTSGNRTIGDTDGGALDGDATLDRAVGPLQFIPSTWAKWRSDGNGDGIANPNNMDDAALATGRYLCTGGRDLATGEGWREAVLSYNFSDDYGRRVYAAAAAYARGSTV